MGRGELNPAAISALAEARARATAAGPHASNSCVDGRTERRDSHEIVGLLTGPCSVTVL